ncbi:uncharacterized protein LOC9645938 isoform X2 [Selaginella moellendorffii]|uniref:uncharacterized protein LOC9645938 isoform X2 n=1 Tax=Selaginella moellendorffii TaxID=88036 RepID=UPI000D1D0C45|nr:uncharacterized protein LOC9645938 isoform X2 [Selaginella moellendorffii]|eukprot:XP_024530343.1 uncharacterized protein LOC9645938 isoform X2 [Selaginella moellendorffii]
MAAASQRWAPCCGISSLRKARNDARPSVRMAVQHKPLGHLASTRKSSRGILEFSKYQGLGNDFVLVDNRESAEPKLSKEDAVRICNRNFGVGSDGVILVMPGVHGCDYTMHIYNPDGSQPEMCGNGIRCMARFIGELEGRTITSNRSYKIHTGAGTIIPTLKEDGQISSFFQVLVDMGIPILNGNRIPTLLPGHFDGTVIQKPLEVDGKTWLVTCVSMGNPHCVTFGEEHEEHLFDLSTLPLEKIGPLFENHEKFPQKTNAEFVEVISLSHLKVRVWERGAGITLACGTGACAAFVAAVLEGRAKKNCIVDLPGGKLEVEWRASDHHVYMSGPAEHVFTGTLVL